jgi:hypothetical protein
MNEQVVHRPLAPLHINSTFNFWLYQVLLMCPNGINPFVLELNALGHSEKDKN